MKKTAFLAAALLAGTAIGASAETLRWARAGDSLTLDPHAQNEGPTHTLSHQIYEPLIIRDMTGAFQPALATDWAPSEDDPSVWVFNLRQGVKFHDGADFTAEDVIFSINRAKSENSNMKELLNSIVEVRAVDDHTVEFVTDGPNPIMPSNLTNLFMMDKGWAEANDAVDVQQVEAGEKTYASTNANGTSAYKLVSREPDVKTVLTRNDDYWGMDAFPMEVTEIVYTPIQNAATRVAALLSGEVDFIQDVPVQDLERVRNTDGLEVKTAPQNRVIFFGMNMGADDIENDDVEGENPLSDVRVRRAMSMAINRDAIKQVVMRGQSEPAGMIAPPFVNGWSEEMDQSETDVEAAKALMDGGGLWRRLLDPARLPQRPLHQRRGDLPGGRGHAGADRDHREPRCQAQGAALPADHQRPDGFLHAGLGRADLRFGVHLQLPRPYPRQRSRQLERHRLFRPRG